MVVGTDSLAEPDMAEAEAAPIGDPRLDPILIMMTSPQPPQPLSRARAATVHYANTVIVGRSIQKLFSRPSSLSRGEQ